MRILQVIHGFLPHFRGGTELHLLGLARELRTLGHDVEIVSGTTHTASPSYVDRYVHDGFPVHKVVLDGTYLEHWTRSLNPDASRLFRETLLSVQPDVVHVHHWYRLSRDLIDICHREGVPAVCTLHDVWTSCPRLFRIREESFCERTVGSESCLDCVPRFPWARDEETAAEIDLFRDDFVNELNLARRVIVPSEAHGALVQSVTAVPEESVVVIPHGSIVALAAERGKSPTPDGEGPIRLGVWGHLFHMKGVHLVLEALGRHDLADDFELHVWGEVVEPNYKARLAELAEGLDVTWHGAFGPDDLRGVPLDLAVIPTLCSESFSFVLDEAFDMGLPTLVPDRGALPERVGDAGAVFEAESAVSLAALLQRVAEDPDVVDAWRAKIPDLTTLEWHAREVAHVYRQVRSEEIDFKKSADPRLPPRRLSVLNDLRTAHERAMFGYLGHIKRETGRADHFESATREAIARQHELGRELAECQAGGDGSAMEILAQEIVVMRTMLRAIDDDQPCKHLEELPRSSTEDLDGVDVPLLGDLSGAIAENADLMRRYAERVGERNAVLALLGGQVVAYRELLGALSSDADFRFEKPDVPSVDVDVPGLGPPAAIVEDDAAILANFFEGQRGRLAAAGERSQALVREIDALRMALRRGNETLGAAPTDPDAEVERLPADVSIERLVEVNQELLSVFYGRIGELRALRDEVGTMQVSLGAKAVLIESLAGTVEELRAAFAALHDEEPVTPTVAEVYDCPDEHVPGLGDLRTLRDVNRDIIRGAVSLVRQLRGLPAEDQDEPDEVVDRGDDEDGSAPEE